MKSSLPPPTAADIARFEKLYALGCYACRVDKQPRQCSDTEIHHQLRGGKRISHQHTVPLGRWHHQAVSSGVPCDDMLDRYGPSAHKHSRAFRARYGSDENVLAHVNRIIEESNQ